MTDFLAALGLVLVLEGIIYGGMPSLAKRLAADGERAKARGRAQPDIYRKLSRATQFPQKFIRWLRIHLFRPTSREHAHAQLKRHLATL